jgi:gliding motility-associated-like protein
MREQLQLGMTIDLSVSSDGAYNLNCAGKSTGFAAIAAVNNTGATSYLWSDGYSGNNRIDIAAGDYKVIITDANNCSIDSTISVTAPAPIILSFAATKPFCPDEAKGEILLTVTGGLPGNDYLYNWSNNSHDRDLQDIKEGLYTVVVSDMNGCSVRDSVDLDSENETCLGIPNAISPNGDLINDTWIIEKIELYPEAVVKVFNNWGVTVWKSERGYATPWDGRSNGVMLPIDSYFYIINLHNGSRQIAGSVTIIK